MSAEEATKSQLPVSAGQPGLRWVLVPFGVVTLGTCSAGLSLGRWHLFASAGPLVRFAAVVWAPVFLLYAVRLRSVARTVGQYLTAMFIFAVLLAWATLVSMATVFSWINCGLDHSPAVTLVEPVVATSETANSGGRHRYLWVQGTPCGNRARVRVPVGASLFARVRVGDRIAVTTHCGRLGAEWCAVGACAAESTSSLTPRP